MDYKVQTSFRIEEGLLLKLKKIAKLSRRSLNGQVEFLLQDFVDQYEKEHGELLLDETE